MGKKLPLFVAGVVFALVAVMQLVRLIYGFSIVVEGTPMPLWANGIALVVAGLLSWWMFSSMCCGSSHCGTNNKPHCGTNDKPLHK